MVFGARGPQELPAQDADCRLVALRFLQNTKYFRIQAAALSN